MSEMKLWLLLPLVPHREPWELWYDKAFGFVVRAETEEAARALAGEDAGDEKAAAWTDRALSTCVELTPDGEPGVILRDFAAA